MSEGTCFFQVTALIMSAQCRKRISFGSIVYNRAVVNKRQNFLKVHVVVHVIIIVK